MKQTWTQEQIISLLREAESGHTTIAQLCRLRGISQNSFYKWRTQYGAMTVDEAPPKGHPASKNWKKRTPSSRSWWPI